MSTLSLLPFSRGLQLLMLLRRRQAFAPSNTPRRGRGRKLGRGRRSRVAPMCPLEPMRMLTRTWAWLGAEDLLNGRGSGEEEYSESGREGRKGRVEEAESKPGEFEREAPWREEGGVEADALRERGDGDWAGSGWGEREDTVRGEGEREREGEGEWEAAELSALLADAQDALGDSASALFSASASALAAAPTQHAALSPLDVAAAAAAGAVAGAAVAAGKRRKWPVASHVALNVKSTWGARDYVGLTALQLLGADGEVLEIFATYIRLLDRHSLTALLDGHNLTCAREHVWLHPFDDSQPPVLEIALANPMELRAIRVLEIVLAALSKLRAIRVLEIVLAALLKLRAIRVWNYNTAGEDSWRGVAQFELRLDGLPAQPLGGAPSVFAKAPAHFRFLCLIECARSLPLRLGADSRTAERERERYGQRGWTHDGAQQLVKADSDDDEEDLTSQPPQFKVPPLQLRAPPHPTAIGARQDWLTVCLPAARVWRLELLATCGDSHYIGLDAIEMYGPTGQRIAPPESDSGSDRQPDGDAQGGFGGDAQAGFGGITQAGFREDARGGFRGDAQGGFRGIGGGAVQAHGLPDSINVITRIIMSINHECFKYYRVPGLNSQRISTHLGLDSR
ncbi:hypothetical protein T492DRAFT_836799 [Pavlovales sp. CCMP2436]|nr:hypothetical protein T492DRAFT_836799 [Pavlovales sp. CCMP2436]